MARRRATYHDRKHARQVARLAAQQRPASAQQRIAANEVSYRMPQTSCHYGPAFGAKSRLNAAKIAGSGGGIGGMD
jgi:hypothetical protein